MARVLWDVNGKGRNDDSPDLLLLLADRYTNHLKKSIWPLKKRITTDKSR
ncbi:MAG: hypothetical protein U1D97_09605 [Desulfuromonadales bacterium]|nr:hypothetical protein [Desulfuromonadales bacterium]